MNKIIGGMAVVALAAGVNAADLPSFTGDVTIAQNSSRLVTINYTLDTAPAVVTVDIQTNGVSIGAANYANFMSGDVNRLVQTGPHTIYWRPDKDWPGRKFVNGEVTAKVRAWPVDDPPPYMIVDLLAKNAVEYRAEAEGVPGGINSPTYKTTKMVMRRLPIMGKNWRLGDLTGAGDDPDKNVAYTVTFTNDYYMAVFPVTAKQYEYMGYTHPYTSGYTPMGDRWNVDWLPVQGLTYETLRGSTSGHNWPDDGHAVADDSVIGKFRARTGVEFDLPTEAVWETACRAGTETLLYGGENVVIKGDTADAVKEKYDDYQISSGPYNYGVGSVAPNAWGFYGMSGRKNHAVLDWYADRTADDGSIKVDPTGPKSGSNRVWKGGAWGSCGATYSARRLGVATPSSGSWAANYVIFRLAAPAIAK